MKFKTECPEPDESVFVVFIVQSTENARGKLLTMRTRSPQKTKCRQMMCPLQKSRGGDRTPPPGCRPPSTEC